MEGLILAIMCLLVAFQVFCLAFSLIKRINPVDFMYGFALWGAVPVLSLNLLTKLLS